MGPACPYAVPHGSLLDCVWNTASPARYRYRYTEVPMRPSRTALSTVLCCALLATFAHATPALSRSASAALLAGRTPARSPLPVRVVVIKRFGAAVRVAPSSTSPIYVAVPCGATGRVLAYVNGWYQVRYDSAQTIQGVPDAGWVGAARVADADHTPLFNCAHTHTFQPGALGYSAVPSGCLSLRAAPSRAALFHSCVPNGYAYTVTNGPLTVGADEWLAVTSPTTGSGWVLAQYLLPSRSSAGGATGNALPCAPSALFAAAVRREGFDPHSPDYAGVGAAAGAFNPLCSGDWAIAVISRPLVGATDGDTLFTASDGRWSEVFVLGYPLTTCSLERVGLPAATALLFARHFGPASPC